MIFLCWLVVQMSLRIELYNGPLWRILFFRQICCQAHQKMSEMFVFNDLYAGWLFKCHCAIDLFNGPFVRNIFSPSMQKKKPSQMSEMSFFYDLYVGQLFESHCAISPFSRKICRQSRQWLNVIFFNDFYAGWLFVIHCAIDLYNGPFVATFIFQPNMSPSSLKNERNVFFYYYLNAGRKFQSRRKKNIFGNGKKK